MGLSFQKRNEGFICENCGAENPPAEKTCRNHCIKCLHSKHVDVFPGDRANTCQGSLIPTSIEIKGGLPANILFTCSKCGKSGRNKIAPDDDRDAIFSIMEKNS